MTAVENGPLATSDFAADPQALALAAFNQNFETFRALNALMWQIPLIAMTLTGGLWFGVSKVDDGSVFRLGLLALALFGNVGLIVILERLRFIIGNYLTWLSEAFPAGHVSAIGTGRLTRGETVKRVFQGMLGFAALISLVLLVATMSVMLHPSRAQPVLRAAAWYDEHAEQIADGYEGLDATVVHRPLFQLLHGSRPLRILDVGAGTGRDAAAIAELGHHVTAVEPSAKMLRLARAIHPEVKVDWVADDLPSLASQNRPYDVVMLSAVWMHISPAERQAAFRRLVELSAPSGQIYLTLRIGPADPARDMFEVDMDEIRSLANAQGMHVIDLADQADLLGRDDVHWKSALIARR